MYGQGHFSPPFRKGARDRPAASRHGKQFRRFVLRPAPHSRNQKKSLRRVSPERVVRRHGFRLPQRARRAPPTITGRWRGPSTTGKTHRRLGRSSRNPCRTKPVPRTRQANHLLAAGKSRVGDRAARIFPAPGPLPGRSPATPLLAKSRYRAAVIDPRGSFRQRPWHWRADRRE
jgi:hypothetical protein